MKRIRFPLNLLVFVGIVLLMLSACTQASPASSELPDGYVLHQIAFPTSDTEKTDFNKDIFEVTPFNIQVAFPVGWSTGEFDSQTETYLYSGIWSRIAIYDEEEKCVGAIGYNIFDLDEESEDELMAIYNQVALGNDYHFDVKNSYTVVQKTDVGETATVDVYYSPVLATAPNSESTPRTNHGILAYNSSALVYVAFEINDSISEETIASIASSVKFVT